MRKKQLLSIICAAMMGLTAPAAMAEEPEETPVFAEDESEPDFTADFEEEYDSEAEKAAQDSNTDGDGKETKESRAAKDSKGKKQKITDNLDEVKDLIEDDDIIETNSLPGNPTVSLEEMWDDQMHNRQFPGFEVDPSRYPAANITENTIILYRFLTRELGLGHAAACGVLANVQLESNFRPLALGDSGTSYGICQWHNGRFSALMHFCKSRELDYNTLEGQMAYLEYELHHGYKGVYEALLQVEDEEDGAYEAAYLFCMRFEMPDQLEARSIRRGNLARTEYYAQDFDVLEWELVHAQLIDGTDWLGLMEQQLEAAALANADEYEDSDSDGDQSEFGLLPAWQSALGEPVQAFGLGVSP